MNADIDREGAQALNINDKFTKIHKYDISINDLDLIEVFNILKRSGFPISSLDELQANFPAVITKATDWAKVEEQRCVERQKEAEQEHEEILARLEHTESELRNVLEIARAQVDNDYNELISRVSSAARERIGRLKSCIEHLRKSQQMLQYYSAMSMSLEQNASVDLSEHMPALNRAMEAVRMEHENIVEELKMEEQALNSDGNRGFLSPDVSADYSRLLESLRLNESSDQ